MKANKGAAGIDDESLADFEENLKGNLYKIWNRMSSGSYFPPPVRAVEIPKKNGGVRILGVPTVADRIAQMVAKLYFEPMVEPYFHKDSYGYRPGKSAVDAVAVTRQPCACTGGTRWSKALPEHPLLAPDSTHNHCAPHGSPFLSTKGSYLLSVKVAVGVPGDRHPYRDRRGIHTGKLG